MWGSMQVNHANPTFYFDAVYGSRFSDSACEPIIDYKLYKPTFLDRTQTAVYKEGLFGEF